MSYHKLQDCKYAMKNYEPGKAYAMLNSSQEPGPHTRPLFSGDYKTRAAKMGIRIALVGPTGAGKSSCINSVAKCIDEESPAAQQSSGGEGTISLGEHFLADGRIVFLDSRGFDYDLTDLSVHIETTAIAKGHVKPEEEIKRDIKAKEQLRELLKKTGNSEIKIDDKAHAVMFVVSGIDPRLKSDSYKSGLQPSFVELRKIGMAITSIVTHADELKMKNLDKSKLINAVRDITGDPNGEVFFVENYIRQNSVTDMPYDENHQHQLLSAMIKVLMTGELFIHNELTREITKKHSQS